MISWRRDSRVRLTLLTLALLLPGCGNTLYATHISAATKRFEEAETLGAEQAAPYEYYSAKVRIAESRALASRGEYGDAMRIARQAEKYSIKARDKTEAHNRSAARQQQTAAPKAPARSADSDGLPKFDDAEAP